MRETEGEGLKRGHNVREGHACNLIECMICVVRDEADALPSLPLSLYFYLFTLSFFFFTCSQLCMEVTILSPPLLREVVKFCETAACALLSAFKERDSEGERQIDRLRADRHTDRCNDSTAQ